MGNKNDKAHQWLEENRLVRTEVNAPEENCPAKNESITTGLYRDTIHLQKDFFKAALHGNNPKIQCMLAALNSPKLQLELLDARYDRQIHKTRIGGHRSFERDCTALHFAAWNGKSTTVALIMDSYCSLTGGHCDPKLKSFLNQKSFPNGLTALHSAAAGGHYECLSRLLNFNDICTGTCHGLIDIDSQEDALGRTALMWATLFDKKRCVHLLLQYGASIDIKDNEGKTAMDIAAQMRNKKTLLLLKSYVPISSLF